MSSAIINSRVLALNAKFFDLAVVEHTLLIFFTLVVAQEPLLSIEGGEDLGHHRVVVDVSEELVVDKLVRGILVVAIEGAVPPVENTSVLFRGAVLETVTRTIVVSLEGVDAGEGIGDVLVHGPPAVLVVTKFDKVDRRHGERGAGERRYEPHGGPSAFN